MLSFPDYFVFLKDSVTQQLSEEHTGRASSLGPKNRERKQTIIESLPCIATSYASVITSLQVP